MAATDVIIPPPEIIAIVDKTADFVAKHGPALEQKILGREAGVKKFEFLLATSVYHAYYRAKVAECSGGASAIAPAPTVAEVAQENVARRASASCGCSKLQASENADRVASNCAFVWALWAFGQCMPRL